MNIQKIPFTQLNPAAYNPRKDLKPGDAEYEKLKRSLAEFGYVEPVIWNHQTGHVVGGHQRLKVLQESGELEIDCVVVDLDEDREKALNIALNKISGDWDNNKLALVISDLTVAAFDVSLTGFEPAELEALMTNVADSDAKDDDADIDALLNKASFVQRGDVWTVGKHRLVCGDATLKEDVDLLMNGYKADLCVTDPPYGIDFKAPTTGLKLMNDNLKGDAFYDFLLSSFKNIYSNLIAGGSCYVFHADTEGLAFRKAYWIFPNS